MKLYGLFIFFVVLRLYLGEMLYQSGGVSKFGIGTDDFYVLFIVMGKKSIHFLTLLLPLFLLILGCGKEITKEVELSSSVFQYCENNGGTSEFRELSDGNELGTCFFLDGSFCDVWDYEEGFCKPGDNPVVKNNVEKIKCDNKDCEELG